MTASSQQTAGSIAYQWWRALNPREGAPSGHQRAALSRMRRAARPLDVMQEPEALRLFARLRGDPDRVAALAGVLACVRDTDERPVARAIGRASLDDETALLSEGRFRRLLQVPHGELMEPMRRVVRIAKGKVNVNYLSWSMLSWSDEVKKHWIFEYYGVAAGIRAEAGTGRGRSEPDVKQQESDHG